MRGATWLRQKYLETKKFQSTLLVRGATTLSVSKFLTPFISIHAPRERSDTHMPVKVVISGYFNPRSSWEERPGIFSYQVSCRSISIHAPRERSDVKILRLSVVILGFQSTLLVRGATVTVYLSCLLSLYFNPRSSWEERRRYKIYFKVWHYFNPRSSWEERRQKRSA